MPKIATTTYHGSGIAVSQHSAVDAKRFSKTEFPDDPPEDDLQRYAEELGMMEDLNA